MTMFELKRLSRDGIPSALGKAERYRLLNQPWEAENIYLDILEVEPDHQDALVGLVLSITDQFDEGLSGGVSQAREVLPRLRDEYERLYYAGLICERRAKAVLRQGGPESGSKAYELLHEARSWYEKAELLRPMGNDDTLLRWNACARLEMRNRHVAPARQERHVAYGDS